MARNYVKLPVWDTSLLTNEPYADTWVISVRDSIRSVLDPTLTHTNWMVSDVTKWNGVTATAQGYAFLVRHMDGEAVPSPTGKEWLIVLGGRYGSGIAQLEDVIGLQSRPTIGQYFVEANGGQIFGYNGAWAVHYNPTALSTPYNGGWDANGELSGGDFTVPTFNPYTNIADFMPAATHPVGYSSREHWSNGPNYGVMIWDDTNPFMAMYFTRGQESYVGIISILGETLIPYLDSDTFTTGNIYLEVNNTYQFSGIIASLHVTMYNSLGSRVSVSQAIHTHERFTPYNQKTPEGDYIWDTALVVSNFGVKGYVDPNIIKVIGEHNGDYYKLFESNGNYFLKLERAMAFPYVGDKPLFPPG